MQGCQTSQLQLVNQIVRMSESNRLVGCCGKYVSESIAGLDNKGVESRVLRISVMGLPRHIGLGLGHWRKLQSKQHFMNG
jgi:hypothetical protein